jgi:predicted Zn-dependent peptidase
VDKVGSDFLFYIMSDAAKDWSKEKILKTLEKYSAAIACQIGIESSSCKMRAINSFWQEILPVFAAVITEPSLNSDDLKLAQSSIEASLKSRLEDPSFYTNELTNHIFYGANHPYFLSIEEQRKFIPQINQDQLRSIHQKIITESIDSVIVVTSLSESEIIGPFEKVFSNLKVGSKESSPVPAIENSNEKNSFKFSHRDIPTAYIQIKMPMPGVEDPDFQAANLMTKIFDDELGLEIRTKRSLSYSIYSYMLNYSRGIGMIGASTSNPKETLEAISRVIQQIQNKIYSEKDLREFKNSYTTSYFLKLEDHASLATGLSRYWHYYRNVDSFYDSPMQISQVTAKDIQRVAQKYLKDFKLGVVYHEKKFKKDWAEKFLKAHL